MAQSVNLWGATYSDVPAIEVPKSGGGMASFTDVTDTTAAASDVATGKYFYTAAGVRTQGTGSGGGGGYVTQDQDGYIVLPSTGGGSPSATQHEIHLEFSDSTDTDIDVYYDDALISTMITAYEPTTYGQKTVTLAQLDGVTWYEPANIPIGVQLVDFTAVTNDYSINASGGLDPVQWYAVSDYTAIENSMTFTYTGLFWGYIGFYDSSKQPISTLYMANDATQRQDDPNFGDGTLNSTKIPPNAKYVRITTQVNPNTSKLSLIRTA